MQIWADDAESIEICAMAPYADNSDMLDMHNRVYRHRFEQYLRGLSEKSNPTQDRT